MKERTARHTRVVVSPFLHVIVAPLLLLLLLSHLAASTPCKQWLTVQGQVLGCGFIIDIFSPAILFVFGHPCHLPYMSMGPLPLCPVVVALQLHWQHHWWCWCSVLTVIPTLVPPVWCHPPSGVIPPGHPWVWLCHSCALSVILASLQVSSFKLSLGFAPCSICHPPCEQGLGHPSSL
jgi:hypothetical protein